jgi:hypothetical protein
MRSTILALALLLAACDGGFDDRHVLPSADAGTADAAPPVDADAAPDAGDLRSWCVVACEGGEWCVLAQADCPDDAQAPAGCGLVDLAFVDDAPRLGPCGT